MKQLEMLGPGIGDAELTYDIDKEQPLSSYILSATSYLPKLKRLKLADLTTGQDGFIEFLRQH
jgi:hypothetical protein